MKRGAKCSGIKGGAKWPRDKKGGQVVAGRCGLVGGEVSVLSYTVTGGDTDGRQSPSGHGDKDKGTSG